MFPRKLCALLLVFTAVMIARAEKIVLVAGGTDDAVNISATRALLKEPWMRQIC